jgi:hypothetical protein
MYNPTLKVCDWPDNVKNIKPNCGVDPGEPDVWEYKPTPKVEVSTPSSGVTHPAHFTEAPFYLTLCDPSAPIIEHPENCYKYLECTQAPNGSFIYAEITCNFNFMFHPKRKTCSPADEVQAIKSICRMGPIAPPAENQITGRPTGMLKQRF